MSDPRLVQCLLFIVQEENSSESDESPRKVYAVIPRVKRYDKLCEILVLNGVKVIDDNPFDPLFTDALKTKKVEFLEVLFTPKLLDRYSQELNIFTEPSDKDIIKVLLPRTLCKFSDRPDNYDLSIYSAFKEENLEIIKRIMTIEADIRHKNVDGGTILHFAVRNRHKGLVRLLLENGASANARTNKDLTPLHLVAANWRPRPSLLIPKLLIEHGADVNATTTKPKYEGATPLHLVLYKGSSLDFAKLFLDNGADINASCSLGSVLTCAVRPEQTDGTPDRVTCLLNYRPDVNNARNREALKVVLQDDDPDDPHLKVIVDLLLGYGFNIIPEDAKDVEVFFGAIMIGNLKLVEQLLKWGADIHSRHTIDDEAGCTPLHQAAAESGEDMLRLLLSYGADVNSKSDDGMTPLGMAALSLNMETVKFLVARGEGCKSDPFLLHIFIRKTFSGHSDEIVDFLLKNGADPNGLNNKGETPSDVALKHTSAWNLKVLFRHGGRLSSDNKKALEILQIAIDENDLLTVQVLAQNCVDIEAIMKDLLIRAIEAKAVTIVKYLLHSSDPSSSMFQDVSILNSALEEHNRDIVLDVLEHSYVSLDLIAESDIVDIVNNVYRGDVYRDFDSEVVSFSSSSDDMSSYDSDKWDLHDLEEEIRKHLVAVRAAHLRVNKEASYSSLRKLMKGFKPERDSCKTQLALMKKMPVGKTNVSFFKLLNSTLTQLYSFTKNPVIVEALKDDSFGAEFRDYSGIIFKRFRQAYYRRKLVELSITVFDVMFERSAISLPHEIIENILTYLSNQNLHFLISAFQDRLPSEVSVDVSDVKCNNDSSF